MCIRWEDVDRPVLDVERVEHLHNPHREAAAGRVLGAGAWSFELHPRLTRTGDSPLSDRKARGGRRALRGSHKGPRESRRMRARLSRPRPGLRTLQGHEALSRDPKAPGKCPKPRVSPQINNARNRWFEATD